MTSDKEIISMNGDMVHVDQELFISLFEADRNRLYSYIFAFMADQASADDIFQETSIILWRDFQKFALGTDFSKWANGIAFNRIRSYRRKNKKNAIGFSEEMLESLATVKEKHDDSDKRWDALQDCREKLSEQDKKIYEAFYVNNQRAQQMADESGRSIFGIRKSIHRLRKKIFDCIDRKKNEGLL